VLGPSSRQHHVRTAADAPVTEGLAEVFVAAVQPHFGADVDKAQHAEGGVHQQAGSVHAGRVWLELQHVVGQVANIADIAEEVVHAVLHELRGHKLIALGQWFEGVGINGIVEGEDRAVDAFPWIIFRRGLCGERGHQDNGTHRN